MRNLSNVSIAFTEKYKVYILHEVQRRNAQDIPINLENCRKVKTHISMYMQGIVVVRNVDNIIR